VTTIKANSEPGDIPSILYAKKAIGTGRVGVRAKVNLVSILFRFALTEYTSEGALTPLCFIVDEPQFKPRCGIW
jgi:hypothetical protein